MDDRDDQLLELNRGGKLVPASGRVLRALTDHEDERLARLDPARYPVLPVRPGGNVLVVHIHPHQLPPSAKRVTYTLDRGEVVPLVGDERVVAAAVLWARGVAGSRSSPAVDITGRFPTCRTVSGTIALPRRGPVMIRALAIDPALAHIVLARHEHGSRRGRAGRRTESQPGALQTEAATGGRGHGRSSKPPTHHERPRARHPRLWRALAPHRCETASRYRRSGSALAARRRGSPRPIRRRSSIRHLTDQLSHVDGDERKRYHAL